MDSRQAPFKNPVNLIFQDWAFFAGIKKPGLFTFGGPPEAWAFRKPLIGYFSWVFQLSFFQGLPFFSRWIPGAQIGFPFFNGGIYLNYYSGGKAWVFPVSLNSLLG